MVRESWLEPPLTVTAEEPSLVMEAFLPDFNVVEPPSETLSLTNISNSVVAAADELFTMVTA